MHCPREAIDIKEYRKLLDLNVVGPLVAMQAAIAVMRRQGGGAIVNISSGTALSMGRARTAIRPPSGLWGGFPLQRAELATDKIVVSLVYPYITKSDFYKNWS